MREEVWAIVRAAIDEATQPLVTKTRDLEARLERAEREAKEARARPAAAPAAASPAPPKVRPIQLSVPPDVYGVAVVERTDKKPDIDLSAVGPVDVTDFGRRRSRMATVVVVLLLLVLGGVVTITILSHA